MLLAHMLGSLDIHGATSAKQDTGRYPMHPGFVLVPLSSQPTQANRKRLIAPVGLDMYVALHANITLLLDAKGVPARHDWTEERCRPQRFFVLGKQGFAGFGFERDRDCDGAKPGAKYGRVISVYFDADCVGMVPFG